MKDAVGDHIILVKSVVTDLEQELDAGTHGFVVEVAEADERYVVEFYVPLEPPQWGDDLVTLTVGPEVFGVARATSGIGTYRPQR
jgi:hypothetical protein